MWTNNSVTDLISGVMKYGPDILDKCISSDTALDTYLNVVEKERLHYPTPTKNINPNRWFIPYEYQNLDIENYLKNLCPIENRTRLETEISLYKKHNMINLLKTMKYIVDTLRANNIVWGVGRGSSVASYTLFLLGVHKVDSVKYNLPIEEFFKGEENG